MASLQNANEMSSMAQRNMRLLETGDYHDFIITCGHKTFKVHRNIVCTQSAVLATLCNPTWKEGSEGCADLNEEDPDTVERVLKFLYTGTYNGECPCTPTLVDSIVDHITWVQINKEALLHAGQSLLASVRVYILADYLDIEGLKLRALENCTHTLDTHFVPGSFVEPISLALANTKSDDPGLRQQIFRSCVAQSSLVKECPQLELLLQDQEPLAWSLLLDAQKQHYRLQTRLDQTQMEAARARGEAQSSDSDLERARRNLRSSVNLVNATKQCRNETCGKEFNAALETYANGYIKSVRCTRCKCRHSVNA